MAPDRKAQFIRDQAQRLGFDRAGITTAAPLPRRDYYQRWLATGRAGRMGYLHRNQELRTDPAKLFDGARSVIVTALNYHQRPPAPLDDRPRGRVARYAWGPDYHRLVRDRLRGLVDAMRAEFDEPFRARICVDTLPILERELAASAGIGWVGKNTLVLDRKLGSYFFLGEIVTSLELATDTPPTDHCGSCTRCLEACPTGAFPAPYEMDASRCISYLTIELREEIPTPFHEPMADWVFGCDVCQEVCPFNRDAPATDAFAVREPGPRPLLDDLLGWTEQAYQTVVHDSAVGRATRIMLQRNARIAARNVAARRSRSPQ